ncbi:MAG: SH3 domain-containing protein [Candidatus Acidiferrales bacterium]
MNKIIRPIFRCWQLFTLIAIFSGSAPAQTTYERTFTKPPDDVQRVVNDLREAARGRLPTLEGFVETPDQPLEQYQRGYYECTFQVTPTSAGSTKVQATAKITAWHTDPTPARSGYRVLVSNGHVENDLLDQIQDALGLGSVTTASQGQRTPRPSASSGGVRPQIQTDSFGLSSAESSSLKGSGSGHSVPPRQPMDTFVPPPAVAAGESVASMKLRRANDEKLAQELTAQIKTLEDALHNQVRPTDLAVVKKSGTPIQTKPSENSQTLLTADAEDEFQVIETEGSWVHVQISGASRGWIRRSQVEMPADYAKTAPRTTTAAPAGTDLFSISRQQTNAFGGNWDPLKGKTVKVIWVEPASATTTPRQKLDFAKALFLKTYTEMSSATPPLQGVVIVFDSADGGQIAATLSSLKQMAAGDLSEAAFWKQCSLDPPESFQDWPTP